MLQTRNLKRLYGSDKEKLDASPDLLNAKESLKSLLIQNTNFSGCFRLEKRDKEDAKESDRAKTIKIDITSQSINGQETQIITINDITEVIKGESSTLSA